MKIINGKAIAQKIQDRVKKETEDLKKKIGQVPGLVSIIIGDDPASRKFVRLKEKAAQKVGFNFELKSYPPNFDPPQILSFIQEKNADKSVHGIIIQLPLPEGFEQATFLKTLHPFKDVDCLHPKNLGLLMMGQPVFLPPTVKAVLKVLESEDVDIKGKKVVIVGGGLLVGKPLSIYLSDLGATVMVVHEHTKVLAKQTKQADILVSATGQVGLIKKSMVKKEAYVLDFGTGERDGKVCGDVEFEEVAKVAKAIAPVPGGMGLVTIATLLENTLESFQRSKVRKRR